MTTAIEETKREMYRLAREMRNDPYHDGVKNLCYRLQATEYAKFESAMEVHLEELRKDLNFACAALDVEAARRAKLVQERDDIQLRLHAVDHAYFVQSEANRVAGEQLREAHKTIADLREAVSSLYVAQNQRSELGATQTLAEVENVAKAATEGLVRQWKQDNGVWCCGNPNCKACKS